mmetsp:Transcript_50861/g.108628  ORF Transcript_50861/g.108628 Transcript_50861/m.108628 type:complete len:222 (-) Transcript_50861:1400-2065(-)
MLRISRTSGCKESNSHADAGSPSHRVHQRSHGHFGTGILICSSIPDPAGQGMPPIFTRVCRRRVGRGHATRHLPPIPELRHYLIATLSHSHQGGARHERLPTRATSSAAPKRPVQPPHRRGQHTQGAQAGDERSAQKTARSRPASVHHDQGKRRAEMCVQATRPVPPRTRTHARESVPIRLHARALAHARECARHSSAREVRRDMCDPSGISTHPLASQPS